jgi:serine-type D-Ala-D-Ala carboxypeptidase (penicillin-binding protein 5/6)
MKDFLKAAKRYQYPGFLFLTIILLVVLILDYFVSSKVSAMEINNYVSGSPASYPILKANYEPYISAKGAIVMDADSQVILYEKNPSLRFAPASTTKIMTALTALEHFNLSDVLTVKREATEGSSLGLKLGQKMTFENLLYALLLPSANDSAFVIAQNYKDEEAGFIARMNENAKKFNLHNTHFEDPAGLLDDQDYTTPLDLARLASLALKNETFTKIVATKQKVITDVDGGLKINASNLNKLLGIDGVSGIKTGYTEGAGGVLVTAKEEKGKTLIIVVMGSEDRFLDTQILMKMVSGNITYLPIHP